MEYFFTNRRSKRKHSSLHQGGFTVVEIAVVVTIFGMMVISLGTFFSVLETSQRSARYLDIATHAAKDEIEQLRNSNYTLLLPGTTIDFSSSLPSGLPAGSTGSAVISDPSLTNLKRVDVTVAYTIGSTPKTVKLTSFIGASGLAQ